MIQNNIRGRGVRESVRVSSSFRSAILNGIGTPVTETGPERPFSVIRTSAWFGYLRQGRGVRNPLHTKRQQSILVGFLSSSTFNLFLYAFLSLLAYRKECTNKLVVLPGPGKCLFTWVSCRKMCLSIDSRRKLALSPLRSNEIPFILPMSSRVGESGGSGLFDVGVVVCGLSSLQRKDLRQQLFPLSPTRTWTLVRQTARCLWFVSLGD